MPISLPSSPCKPALRPGTLEGLLQPAQPSSPSDDVSASDIAPRSRARPVLLQVTNITPALSGADPFSGHHGFYLRLSDSAHSCYVSLHADHDDLILTNSLHIGQLIEVDGLVPSIPAPILREFRVLPGRYPCIQEDSADLVASTPDDSACSSAEIKEIVSSSISVRPRRPTPPLPERKARPARIAGHQRSRSIQNLSETGTMTMKRRELERRSTEVLRKLRKISVTSVDDDSSDESDVSSSYSSSSFVLGTTAASRRSWDCTGSIEDRRPVPLRRSASVSPNRSCQVSCVPRNGAAHELAAVRKKAEKAFKVLSKRNPCASNKMAKESSCTGTPHGPSNGIKWCKNNVVWASLSSSLVRHGKEALKQRDMALQAALDALLEASTTEKLIHCLSVYSELQSDKDDDPKEFMERFLKFYQELDEAIFVAQSQTKLRQYRTCNSNSATSGAAKAAMKVVLERKQSAVSWIRAALESDLSYFPSQTKITAESTMASFAEAKLVTPLFSCCYKPKCNCSNKWRKSCDVSAEGGGLTATTDLANALRSECNRWFLKYIDKFLDAIENETGYAACDSQIASILQQLKRVDDWLNRVARHEKAFSTDRSNKDSMLSEEEENDACERVRKKIYGVLLRHVQHAAMALESMTSATDEEKEQD